jgi:hypothetical protein
MSLVGQTATLRQARVMSVHPPGADIGPAHAALPFRATSGLIDNANKTVFQLTIQKRARRIFAVQGAWKGQHG